MSEPLAKYSSIYMGSVAGHLPSLGAYDPNGITRFLSGVFSEPPQVVLGKVQAYHPATHSAAVRVGNDVWPCVFADERLSFSFGYSESYPPRDGENVLVMPVKPGVQSGFIIGRLPRPMPASKSTGDPYNDPDGYNRQLYTQLEKSRDTKIPTYTKPISEKNDHTTHVCTHFRPTDVVIGEFANVNQHNCGIKGGLFSTTLLGGGASLRMSALTNGARLTCESYKRHSMLGNVHEFHNGRYLSSERDVAMYQEERFGGIVREAGVWTDDAKEPSTGENQTLCPRMKELSGYFGHLYSRFCMRPDENTAIRVLGDEAKEAGVCRETIDPSGQYRLSSAGMIAIERTGRIPVPVRKAYPTDKGHDISSDPKALEPFEHKDDDPNYRQLELFDRQAYDLKNQYSRVDGEDQDEPDYYVPQEEDLQPLKDKYDTGFTNSETVKLKDFDKRRAGVYIGEDGSIIMRDAWGSEIVMLAGNVTISCAGNVMMLPGKTQLTIAGDDIVQKAQNSVDIHASEHDVRLSAAKNMEIVGGGDEKSHSGGVIIESRGSGAMPWDGKDKGESAQVSGITLRTNNQAIVADGQYLVMRSRKSTRIVSGDKDIDGDVGIGARTIRVRSKSRTLLSSGEAGHVSITPSSVVVSANNAILTGARSASLINGGKFPVPAKWQNVENVAEQYNPQLARSAEDLADESKASLSWNAEALEKMVFGFRTSEECSTTSPWSVGTSGSEWSMYEPAWVQVKDIYETLKGVGTKAYKEESEWDNGKPFPGKESEDSAKYVQLSGLKPKNLTSDGFNKSRKEVEKESSIEPVAFKDGYLVRQ